jgi:hypothetical protein
MTRLRTTTTHHGRPGRHPLTGRFVRRLDEPLQLSHMQTLFLLSDGTWDGCLDHEWEASDLPHGLTCSHTTKRQPNEAAALWAMVGNFLLAHWPEVTEQYDKITEGTQSEHGFLRALREQLAADAGPEATPVIHGASEASQTVATPRKASRRRVPIRGKNARWPLPPFSADPMP